MLMDNVAWHAPGDCFRACPRGPRTFHGPWSGDAGPWSGSELGGGEADGIRVQHLHVKENRRPLLTSPKCPRPSNDTRRFAQGAVVFGEAPPSGHPSWKAPPFQSTPTINSAPVLFNPNGFIQAAREIAHDVA
jgi:hypothetical protein